MVAYQMHERLNETGYPRGFGADHIHDLAKIAAVSDVFTALVSPRPHRQGMMPYYAIKEILYAVNEGLYDADVVRALLHTTSLFPIGSYVSLHDDRVGRVIRSNGGKYTEPVVEVWEQGNLNAQPVIVDVSVDSNPQIVNAIPELTASDS